MLITGGAERGKAQDKRIPHFLSTTFNIVEFNMLWQSNSVPLHPTSFTIIQYHSTLWPKELLA